MNTKIISEGVTIYNSVAAIYVLTFIGGLTPVISNNQSWQIKYIGYALRFFWAVMYYGCFTISMLRRETVVGYFFKNKIASFGDIVLVILAAAAAAVIFVGAIRRNCLKSILTNMEVVDKEFNKIGFQFFYSRIRNYTFFVAVILSIVNLAYYVGGYYLLTLTGVTPATVIYFTFFSPYACISLTALQFISSMKLIRCRMAQLNRVLQLFLDKIKPIGYTLQIQEDKSFNFLDTWKYPFAFDKNVFFRLRNPIEAVMQIHNHLCDVCEILEDCLGQQMLAIIGVSFLYIIFDTYYILQSLFQGPFVGNTLSREVTIFFSIQLILYIIIIAAITEQSHATTKENRISFKYVHKIISFETDPNDRDLLIALALQLANRELKFSAAGLFYLDRSLYLSIAGAITTYLIILIQFSVSS